MNKKPSWDRIAAGHDPADAPDETQKIRAAFARAGRTDDGKIISKYLAAAHVYAPIPDGLSDGALRDRAATQRIAIRFLSLLNGDLNDGRDDPTRERSPGGWRTRVDNLLGSDGE